MNAPLSKKLNEVKWGEFKIGDLFEIQNTLSFNANKLVEGNEYDYVTRTSFNQGILQTTGFVNETNVNPSGTWSLGLLQMDFFYRRKPWYAGQFVRKIVPKFDLPKNAILFFTTLLNMQKKVLLSVLVRNVDEKFRNIIVSLPITPENKIDFDFMEAFIRELEEERIRELEEERIRELAAYLKVSGFDNYELSKCESEALAHFNELKWKEFNLIDIFDVKNTHNILSNEIKKDSGSVPYLCASSVNNGVSSYISYKEELVEKGNCIFIGGKTFVVSYQEKDFFSNDSHNLALYVKDLQPTKLNQLYLATCVYKGLSHKYTWGDSISGAKIKSDKIMLPITSNGSPDYAFMETFISAVQKLVIKDVVLYADKKIAATKQAVHKNPSDYKTPEGFGALKVAEHN